ncbi:MAG: 2-oxoglutarate dehydrogenase E1 component [Gammaproteobacteria bacterium]|nr:2-oxoglutarate dehydrogenase E1 component [Gammaproteobacteria bacterium]
MMNTAWQSSYFSASNASYLEALYEDFLKAPEAVPADWQTVFKSLPGSPGAPQDILHSEIRNYFYKQAREPKKLSPQTFSAPLPRDIDHEKKQVRVIQLINAFRFRGHQLANCDPLNLCDKKVLPELTLSFHNLSEEDTSLVFNTGTFLNSVDLPLREIFQVLSDTYCKTIGLEVMHMTETQEKRWIQNRFESIRGKPQFSADIKTQILNKLIAAEGLEKYLHTRYVGQKRFSLEGGESIIPALDDLISRAGASGIKEIVIGMAHRGRLNVLVNLLGRSPERLFQEFEGKYENNGGTGSGDVKYHLGFSSDIQTKNGPIHVALAFNPSHLEIVSPVVVGSVRARQYRYQDLEKTTVLPVMLHGDAAFSGQGVVMETFNMSQTRGFSVGGTLHIILNNQIGFTTSQPQDARSTSYASDVAKMVLAPIFHVNADDPEAVLFVMEAAFDYRMTFKKDVVVDLVCYRRHGHNEADEPSATQPVMYQRIKQHPTTLTLYSQKLIQEGLLTEEGRNHLSKDYRALLEAGNPVISNLINKTSRPFLKDWMPFLGQTDTLTTTDVNTKVPEDTLKKLAYQLEQMPKNFTLHPRVKKIMEDRQKMTRSVLPADWGYAETLAYASLLNEGFAIRLSGQDTSRGTFFHRHAVLHDAENGKTHTPLAHIKPEQPLFMVIDSPLSEEAVLAFEYGYSTTDPKTLVIWEAQYGDFANGAQVVIDQFISSGEQKWGRLSGLVLFLPHSYEGQGPEHSSARLERYLQLSAQHNMQVLVPSTPAQVFHMLRRQLKNRVRKPLIVMTPKSILRHKLATSTLAELAEGSFQPVIGEINPHDPKKITRIILCSGKLYYDLLVKREETKNTTTAIFRIEQLYPFPEAHFCASLEQYSNAQEVVWCQEEPKNQGAWYSSQHHFRHCLQKGQTLQYVGRPDSASPAVGYSTVHAQQEEAILKEALQT